MINFVSTVNQDRASASELAAAPLLAKRLYKLYFIHAEFVHLYMSAREASSQRGHLVALPCRSPPTLDVHVEAFPPETAFLS
jgi:hypothetical protein